MRLRRLVATGFKSFADRTEFVFDDGITCVVGPNGCGKSNVVDAIKWVLGEQSAKSLRGSEMMDVIFNGCATRRASGLAEVTLEFDNEGGTLQPVAGGEVKGNCVSVTRKLYRSGESEYLINGQVVRLRDIREMFLDTGIGNQGYSLIEQGKVAEMLQSNPADRREIFEEAAGISKYKARKKEAIRKLERVEQNLLRLNDILAEVQKRLRSIKYQAGKARSYQAYSERLKELRGLFSLAQYHKLRGERTSLQGQLDQLNDRLTGIGARIDQLEANRTSAEAEMADLERQARQIDGQIASLSAQVVSAEQRIEMLVARIRELDEQMAAAKGRDEELKGRIASANESIAADERQAGTVELQIRQAAEQIEAMMEEQQSGQLAMTRFQADLEDEKAGTIDLLRRTSQLHNEITATGVRRENLLSQKQRLSGRAEEIAQQIVSLLAGQAQENEKLREIQQVLDEAADRLEAAKSKSAVVAREESHLDAEIGQARELRSSLASRRGTLEEMLLKHEGLTEGVRRVLEAAQGGGLTFVRGILADFVRADFDSASVIESALAGMDQYVLVESTADLLAGRAEIDQALAGAGVEVLCLDRLSPWRDELDLSLLPVRAERAADMAQFDSALAPWLWRLLGRTLVVDDLSAVRTAQAHAPAGYRFVTRDGAVLEGDGRVRLGSPAAASGVITRRSELEKLSAELARIETVIADRLSQRRIAAEKRTHLDEVQQKLRTAVYEANTERVDHQGRSDRIAEQLAQIRREQPILAKDIESVAGEIEQAVHREHEAREKVAELEALSCQRQKRVDELNTAIAAARQRHDHLAGQLADYRVQHAQACEQRARLRDSAAQLLRSIEQMERQRAESAAQVEADQQRRQGAEESIAAARKSIDQLFASKEELEQQARETDQTLRAGLVERVEQIRHEIVSHRRAHEEASQAANQRRVEVGEADVRIENLITRSAEELGVDLATQYAGYSHDGQRDWDAVNVEIQDLREKIERLGNVNLDAIAEQDELEQREKFLSGQLADIQSGQKQLTELIVKINKLSRELFETTFNAIRDNFQTIFRKLFGGGKADILLDNPDDVLESGIEIIARPPGKELRSISLLSGGEKTMATVALLFSIFRAKPSPYCVLDEVDAALDEANNERFNGIVQEFLDQSQFIIITHSKRTMSIGNVLYGVTMQEAGVSKRVSVKFEEAAELAEAEESQVPQ